MQLGKRKGVQRNANGLIGRNELRAQAGDVEIESELHDHTFGMSSLLCINRADRAGSTLPNHEMLFLFTVNRHNIRPPDPIRLRNVRFGS